MNRRTAIKTFIAAGLAPSVALPLSPIVIRLGHTGSADDAFTLTIDRFASDLQSFDELPTVLIQIQNQPGFDIQTPVVIVAEQEVQWDHVVSCWNAALRAGYTNIAFAEP